MLIMSITISYYYTEKPPYSISVYGTLDSKLNDTTDNCTVSPVNGKISLSGKCTYFVWEVFLFERTQLRRLLDCFYAVQVC